MSIKFSVIVDPFAERYYIKKFRKKYKEKKWDVTREALEAIAANPLQAVDDGVYETVVDVHHVLICKQKFAIAGMNQSPNGSGNRVILSVDKNRQVTRVLLVYYKTDLSGKGNETAQWKKLVKENYPEYRNIL